MCQALLGHSKVGMLTIGLAYACSAEVRLHDTGLYHAQNIKWIQEYAVVPGLGNVHGRFAFNSMFFPVSALFSIMIGETASHHQMIYPVNPVMVLTLAAALLYRLFVAAKGRDLGRTAFFALAFIPVAIMYPSWANAPSPNMRRNRLGMLKARKKASAPAAAPKNKRLPCHGRGQTPVRPWS